MAGSTLYQLYRNGPSLDTARKQTFTSLSRCSASPRILFHFFFSSSMLCLQIPDTTEEDAGNSAEVDWLRDTARWGGRMTREAFGSSMFELADIWTENINEEEVRKRCTIIFSCDGTGTVF